MSAEQRPRNLMELADQYRPATPEPWPAGTYVLMGTSGKRAHWTGDRWKGGDSPGYTTPTSGDADSSGQNLSSPENSEQSEDPEDYQL